MSRRFRILLLTLLLLLPAYRVRAWDFYGHAVVARIAWENMTPQARARVLEILKSAPPKSNINDLWTRVPENLDGSANAPISFVTVVASWPDMLRDAEYPERRALYHQGSQHYTNIFWESGRTGEPRLRRDLKPDAVNILSGIETMYGRLLDEDLPDSSRAIALAWVLHLAGDIHQPLHTSARVTRTEPKGDEGGNLFKLDEGHNLHGYWDRLISGSTLRRENETEYDYINRLACGILKKHPKNSIDLKEGHFEAWIEEGFETASTQIYSPDLIPGRRPLLSYRKRSTEAAEAAIARAGYRLAELLNRLG